jgi:hypothetical protein
LIQNRNLGGLFREEGRTEAAAGEITRRGNGGGEWWDSCRAAKEEVRDVGNGLRKGEERGFGLEMVVV